MNYIIVTNNPIVKNEYNNAFFVKGTFEDVLIKVRDLVYEGYELVSHPLAASIRMLFSPFRSVIISEKNNKISFYYVETIENSIINYRKHVKMRKTDMKNADDYALIDNELLKSALRELKNNCVNSFV